MLKERSAVMQFVFGKTPRDFAVLGETSAALLLGAGGQTAEVPVKQFQQCSVQNMKDRIYLKKNCITYINNVYKIHKIID